jgi:hypothetical protein
VWGTECCELEHRHQSQPGIGIDCSEIHDPQFLETEIDRERALETEQFMHFAVTSEQFFSEIPTRLFVLLLSKALSWTTQASRLWIVTSWSFEFLTAVTMKITAFWHMMPCSLAEKYWRCGGTSFLHVKGRRMNLPLTWRLRQQVPLKSRYLCTNYVGHISAGNRLIFLRSWGFEWC